MKTIVFNFHPNYQNSVVNKLLVEHVSKDPNVTIKYITQFKNTPENIKVDQEAMMAADRIVFMYPLYWYAYPGIGKDWIDTVFQYGWAFGSVNSLEGKKFRVVITTGGRKVDYEGTTNLLTAVPHQCARYMKMVPEEEFIVYSDDAPQAAEKLKF